MLILVQGDKMDRFHPHPSNGTFNSHNLKHQLQSIHQLKITYGNIIYCLFNWDDYINVFEYKNSYSIY